MLVFRSWGDFSEDPRLKDPNVQSAFRFPGLNDREITLIPLHTNIGELRSAYETNRAKALNKDIPFVLLIDDTETNLKIWSFILGELKIPFETANDGREAVRKVTCSSLRPYDIIITDIKMPTDGITTARTILAMLQNPETPQSKPIDILYCSTERKEDVARMMGDRASPFNHQESLPKDDPQGFKNKLVAFIKEKFPKYTLPPQRENTASEEDDRELLEMLGLN
jgi:CheY-like chemotaxis protein